LRLVGKGRPVSTTVAICFAIRRTWCAGKHDAISLFGLSPGHVVGKTGSRERFDTALRQGIENIFGRSVQGTGEAGEENRGVMCGCHFGPGNPLLTMATVRATAPCRGKEIAYCNVPESGPDKRQMLCRFKKPRTGSVLFSPLIYWICRMSPLPIPFPILQI